MARKPLYKQTAAVQAAHANAKADRWRQQLLPLLQGLGLTADSTDLSAVDGRDLIRVSDYVSWGSITEYGGLGRRCLDEYRRRKGPAPWVDPYWSLWGRIKAGWNSRLAMHEQAEAVEGTKLADLIVEAYYLEADEAPTLRLPTRKTPISGTDSSLTWTGPDGTTRSKQVRNDAHAVNTLRKLDTDDSYFGNAE